MRKLPLQRFPVNHPLVQSTLHVIVQGGGVHTHVPLETEIQVRTLDRMRVPSTKHLTGRSTHACHTIHLQGG